MLGQASSYQIPVVFADEDDVEILVVVGEVRRRGLAYRCAVTGPVLAEIGDLETGIGGRTVQILFNPGRARDSFGLLTVDDEIKAEIIRV